MASLLAVATGFIGFWTLNIYTLQSGGGLICVTSQKCRGGLMSEARVGVIVGFYGIYFTIQILAKLLQESGRRTFPI
jgi:hypothetical protein